MGIPNVTPDLVMRSQQMELSQVHAALQGQAAHIKLLTRVVLHLVEHHCGGDVTVTRQQLATAVNAEIGQHPDGSLSFRIVPAPGGPEPATPQPKIILPS